MIFSVAAFAVLISMGLALIRALKGPTVFDIILVVTSIGTKTILLIAILGFLNDRPEFLDLGLVYTMINFIGTIAVLKFIENKETDTEIELKD